MRICIIGGGISGLYCANILANKNNIVTIFEKDKWGGDIQSTNIDNKCYPISTLFVMPDDTLLKNILKSNNIYTSDVELDKNMIIYIYIFY